MTDLVATGGSSATATPAAPHSGTGALSMRNDYFDVMREPLRAAEQEPSEVFRGRMKLGATYNVFDGEELLEASIRSIRAGGVDLSLIHI